MRRVGALVTAFPELGTVKDVNGRVAVDVAATPMRKTMQAILNWHGQYRITDRRPEHVSPSCYVFKAVDENTIDPETSQPLKVALKLVRKKTPFMREMAARNKHSFSGDFVVATLQARFSALPRGVVATWPDGWPEEVGGDEVDILTGEGRW